ncbi:MAG: general stress protein [Actinomycetota bacterium]|nr:general stress protein [Actinomycetota bacterium]
MGRLREHNVVATFSDMESARAAMKELSQAGIDANNISMLGREAEATAVTRDTRERDFEVAGDIGKKTAGGAAVGGAVGGAIAGAAAFLIPGIGPVVGVGIWAAAAGGALAGSTAGGLVGGISALPLNEDWELTYADSVREGRVLVAVHTNDDDEAARAVKVFEKGSAEKVQRLDSEGRPAEQTPSS